MPNRNPRIHVSTGLNQVVVDVRRNRDGAQINGCLPEYEVLSASSRLCSVGAAVSGLAAYFVQTQYGMEHKPVIAFLCAAALTFVLIASVCSLGVLTAIGVDTRGILPLPDDCSDLVVAHEKALMEGEVILDADETERVLASLADERERAREASEEFFADERQKRLEANLARHAKVIERYRDRSDSVASV